MYVFYRPGQLYPTHSFSWHWLGSRMADRCLQLALGGVISTGLTFFFHECFMLCSMKTIFCAVLFRVDCLLLWLRWTLEHIQVGAKWFRSTGPVLLGVMSKDLLSLMSKDLLSQELERNASYLTLGLAWSSAVSTLVQGVGHLSSTLDFVSRLKVYFKHLLSPPVVGQTFCCVSLSLRLFTSL